MLVIIGHLQLWPVEVPNFKEHVLDLWKDTHELSLRVLSTVTIGMGLVSSILGYIGGVKNRCNWSVDYKLTNKENIKANLLNFFLISLME